MNAWKILTCLCGALITSVSFGAGATERLDWRTDCVGRFSLELPGEVVVAMAVGTPNDEYLFGPKQEYRYRFAGFPDETAGVWQSLRTVGHLSVLSGPQVDAAGFAQYRQWMDKRFESLKKDPVEGYSPEEAQRRIQPIQTLFPNSHAWRWNRSEFLLLWRDSRLFGTENNGGKYDTETRYLSDHLRSRELFEVPQERGLCLNYGFLPDDGTLEREISVSYRLKDHPEIEIYFSDSSASLNPYPKREGTVSDDMKNFWNRDHRFFVKELRLISPHIPGMTMFPDVKIAGFTGKRSLVKITRENDAGHKHIDYGYAAIVRGDSAAKDDQPDLLLYVISDYRRAKGTPLTKDQIEEIADHIAASIRRR